MYINPICWIVTLDVLKSPFYLCCVFKQLGWIVTLDVLKLDRCCCYHNLWCRWIVTLDVLKSPIDCDGIPHKIVE